MLRYTIRSTASVPLRPHALNHAYKHTIPNVNAVTATQFNALLSQYQLNQRSYTQWSTSVSHVKSWTQHAQLAQWYVEFI